MTGYLNAVIITVVVCQIAQMIVPESDILKRGIRMLCALVMLLTILTPVRHINTNIDQYRVAIERWVQEKTEVAEADDPIEQTAQAVMEHAVQVCGLSPDGMKVTLLTDDTTQKLTEIQLFVRNCSYADREAAQTQLSEIYGIHVRIYNTLE